MSNVGGGFSRASTSVAVPSPLPRRPASIQELAQRAELIWDPSKDFKFWLKFAERARHAGQDHDLRGDLENAFVEYAKAATLILDKIPTHRDYQTRLDATQRETLIIKGKGVLDRMGMIKPPLIDRHNAWEEAQARGGAIQRVQPPQKTYEDENGQRSAAPSRKPSINGHHRDGRQIWYPDPAIVAQEKQRRGEPQLQIVPQASAEQRAREQAGIAQRQREAEEEARATRRAAAYNAPSSSQSGFVTIPAANPVTPQRSSARPSGRSTYILPIDTPPLLPLESPVRHDGDSTDADTEEGDDEELYIKISALNLGPNNASTVSLVSPFGGPAPPPITTTSAPPSTLSAVSYPQLMSQHQRTQGYAPSLQSMFMQPSATVPQSTLLFENAPVSKNLYQNILPAPSQPFSGYDQQERERDYSQHNRAYMYGPREPQPHVIAYPTGTSPRPIIPPRPPQETLQHSQPPPATLPVHPANGAPRIAPASSDERRDLQASRELKTVNFPRAVLQRFLSIASVNTAKNRETCGLLLGKPKGNKYVVTTLLVPKQHSTSDTCTMDEEELVLEFTEKRTLITLGWIHTHPTQSCFMSSVDLHTHSGFQRMLPESFAVVCAPQHTPTFGIFRLTDPPGLQTILKCGQTNAFHPHPELPIYTDADKGHVQMKDMSLEIVDLR
ncbi:hypothetical protein M0805_007203 [Coniferiporia weirii]|nr:hypothetical protein M0805_007203 [Coniferiporia weirii]